jgi:hypothetical protein
MPYLITTVVRRISCNMTLSKGYMLKCKLQNATITKG